MLPFNVGIYTLNGYSHLCVHTKITPVINIPSGIKLKLDLMVVRMSVFEVNL